MCEAMLKPNSSKSKCEIKSQDSVIGYIVFALAIIFVFTSIVFNSVVSWKKQEGNEDDRNTARTKIQYMEPVLMIQILILMPILNITLSDEVVSFYRATKHILLSFSFIPIDTDSFYMGSSKYTNDYKALIDIKPDSSFVSMLQVLLVFTSFSVLFGILQLLRKCFNKYDE